MRRGDHIAEDCCTSRGGQERAPCEGPCKDLILALSWPFTLRRSTKSCSTAMHITTRCASARTGMGRGLAEMRQIRRASWDVSDGDGDRRFYACGRVLCCIALCSIGTATSPASRSISATSLRHRSNTRTAGTFSCSRSGMACLDLPAMSSCVPQNSALLRGTHDAGCSSGSAMARFVLFLFFERPPSRRPLCARFQKGDTSQPRPL